MSDQPSKMMQDVLAKIEQEKRERRTPPPAPVKPVEAKPAVPSYIKPHGPQQMRLIPNYVEQSRNAEEVRKRVMQNLGKRCPICQNLATFRRPHRYHCATCHVFIDLD